MRVLPRDKKEAASSNLRAKIRKGTRIKSMLQEALCVPGDQDIYYHYCSAQTFQAICDSKAVRFSDATTMNDAAEMAWGHTKLIEAGPLVTKLRDTVPEFKDLDAAFFASVAVHLERHRSILHPFFSAFSRQPDVLSQWRAYADDGRGFSIGINGKALKSLPASLYEVVYDPNDQLMQARNALGTLYMAYKAKSEIFPGMVGSLLGSLLAFKNPAFAEEQEIRSVHLVDILDKGNGPMFVDVGETTKAGEGETRGAEVAGETIRYRVREGSLIAYFDMPLAPRFSGQVIRQVWLGPKNMNSVEGDVTLTPA
jgi:hypothetical protein